MTNKKWSLYYILLYLDHFIIIRTTQTLVKLGRWVPFSFCDIQICEFVSPANCQSVRSGTARRPSGLARLNLTTILHLPERRMEDPACTKSRARSCEMIGIVNVVILLQWSHGMEGQCDGVIVSDHAPSSTASPPLLSFLLAVTPSLLCSLVKDSSPSKLNQTAWIKAITQFVYKASFILCQAALLWQSAAGWPLTLAEVTWCIYYIVQWESFRLLSGDKGLKMHDGNSIIQICATLYQNTKCSTWPYQQTV